MREAYVPALESPPEGGPELRLVESFATREEAEAALLRYAELLCDKADPERFGVSVRPVHDKVPGQRWSQGWAVWLRDRGTKQV